MWNPFKRRPQTETRAAFPSVTDAFLSHRRDTLKSDGTAALSATVATAAGMWSRGLSMLDSSPDPGPLTPDMLATIGLDLALRGEAVFHITVQRGDLALDRVAYWDQFENGRWYLHIPRLASTDTVKALSGEVLHLKINSSAEQPWAGRSPFLLMGGSPSLVAEIERAVSLAMEWTGRGLLPFPDTVPEEMQSAALRGLKGGNALAAIKSRADFATNVGQPRAQEFKRVELGPDLTRSTAHELSADLHHRTLAAAGIPAALVTGQGNAGAMREAFRQFSIMTIEPLARQMLPELSKIGVSGLSSASMAAADTAGRARSVGALVKAGVELERAMKLVGWSDD